MPTQPPRREEAQIWNARRSRKRGHQIGDRRSINRKTILYSPIRSLSLPYTDARPGGFTSRRPSQPKVTRSVGGQAALAREGARCAAAAIVRTGDSGKGRAERQDAVSGRARDEPHTRAVAGEAEKSCSAVGAPVGKPPQRIFRWKSDQAAGFCIVAASCHGAPQGRHRCRPCALRKRGFSDARSASRGDDSARW